MTPRTASLAAGFFLVAMLASPLVAQADDVWNPFMFLRTCSSCGALTPLTLEQADGAEVLSGGSRFDGNSSDDVPLLGPALPTSAHEPDGAPGIVNANGPGVSAAPVAGVGLGIAAGNGEGLQYGLTLPNSNISGGTTGDAGAPNPPAVIFTLGDSTGSGQSADLGTSGLSPTDGTGSGPGSSGQTLVPEPTSMLLFGTGLTALGVLSRRKRRPR